MDMQDQDLLATVGGAVEDHGAVPGHVELHVPVPGVPGLPVVPVVERRLGPAVRLTPNSIRLRLLELDQPWQAALDAVLEEAERAVDRPALLAGVGV